MSRQSRYCDHFIYVCMVLLAFSLPLSLAASRGALMLALLGWLSKVFLEKKLNWERTPVDYALLVFLAAGVLSALSGGDPANSLAGMRIYWILLIIHVLFNNVYEAGRVKVLVSALFVGAAVAALHANWHSIRALAGGVSPGLVGDMSRAGRFMLVCGLASACFLYKKTGRERLIFLLFALFMSGAVALQFNCGALAGLLVLFLVQGALKSPKKTAFVLAGVLFIFALFQPVREFLQYCNDERPAAAWLTVPAVIREHPAGAGLNNVGVADAHPHNSYLRVLVELGPLGLGAFVALIAVYLRTSFNLFRRIPEKYPFEKGFALGGFSAFGGFLANGLVEDNFGDQGVAMLVFLIMGMTFIIDRKMKF